MDYQQIAYDLDGHVLTITLDRPDKLNAFTARMMHEVLDALDRADADDDVRAVVFTGRGRAFCAGADLSAGASSFDASAAGGGAGADVGVAQRDGGGLVSLRLYEMKKPVIAAINGPAVGVGITMTLPMDVRLCSDSARIGFVFARRGLVPEACSSWFLPRLVGISQALEWVLTGRVFDAAEAQAGGLVRSVHPGGELLAAARALADEIVSNTAPVSVALSRQMLWRMLGADHPMEAHKV
ncbi:MAG TPA: enoyl-CoA hydratase-related protein, partial [Acidimicrobiales bacterium]|nr:enoyl-CoA hydratase-related protein [Acidimicrobiales bacterium]